MDELADVKVEDLEAIRNNESGQQVLFNLEEVTARNVGTVGQLREEIKKIREMLEDGYLGNESYQDQAKKLNDEKKNLERVKKMIDSLGAQRNLHLKLKEKMEELREKTGSISEYVLEISRITGANQIEVDGVMYDIVKSAKLVRRGK